MSDEPNVGGEDGGGVPTPPPHVAPLPDGVVAPAPPKSDDDAK